MTGIRKKNPAIRKVLEDSLQLRERAEIAKKIASGEWTVELDRVEAAKSRDRDTSSSLGAVWRK